MNPWPARHAARRFFSGPSSRLSLGQGGYNKYRGQPPGNGGLPLYIWIAAGGTTAVIGYGYFAFLDEAPLTKRKRWLAISPAWEQQMGDEQYQQLLQAFRNDILPPDHRAAVTVRRVGSRIAQASTEFCQEHCLPVASTGAVTAGASSYTYTVVRSDTANAFVLPGRHIFVMTGLFDHVHNEDELAAVLGHEIAHNVARHAGEKVSGSLAVNLLARLSLLVDPSGVLFSVILPAANVLRELPNSRTQETEADQIGVHIAAKACYDPRAAKRVFANMKAASEGQATGPEFLSTHPSHDTRIANFDQWLPAAMQEYQADFGDRCRHVRRDMDLARQQAARTAALREA